MVTSTAIPRLVIAAPASGHGKTTVATGLMAALRRAGHRVSGHKVGPDYIDPGYHSLATGQPGRNLDAHLCGEDLLAPLFLHGAGNAEVAIVEGVMGLFDGALARQGFASTAHVARLLQAPIVLVVDCSHASRSIAAVVHGCATFDPTVRIGGVILNKPASPRHIAEILDALSPTGIEVLGVLPRDEAIATPSRHLGLVPAQERGEAASALDRLAVQIKEHVHLDRVMALAATAPPMTVAAWSPEPPTSLQHGGRRPRIAIAAGRAFTFRYAETEEVLRAFGADVVEFDPLADERLPEDLGGLYLGGGFPEVHAEQLSVNAPLRAQLRALIAQGLPTVAECAGLLYLCDTLDGAPMIGAIPAHAAMTPRLTLGYRTATAPGASLLGGAGTQVTGHEFHRTGVQFSAPVASAWEWAPPLGSSLPGPLRDGIATPSLHASYLHTHWAGAPELAHRFVQAAAAFVPQTASGYAVHG